MSESPVASPSPVVSTSSPSPTATAETAAAETYEVQSGDTLATISQQFYGSANQYMKIFEANRDQLNDPNKIQAGQELKIPS